jgi:hypothetical protein
MWLHRIKEALALMRMCTFNYSEIKTIRVFKIFPVIYELINELRNFNKAKSI